MKQNTNPNIAQIRTALKNLQKWSRGQIGKSNAPYPQNVIRALNEAAEIALKRLESKTGGMQFSQADAGKIEKESDSALKFARKYAPKSDERRYFKTVGETLAKLAFFPHSFVVEYRDYDNIPYNSFGAASSSKVTPERAARRRIIPAADPYERERLEKEADELAELERAAEARAEARLDRYWSRRY